MCLLCLQTTNPSLQVEFLINYKMYTNFFIMLVLCTDLLQGTTNKYHNCTGEVIIPDKAHELHTFTGNNTKLEKEVKLIKRDLVTVKAGRDWRAADLSI